MNVFYLDPRPKIAAQYHVDKHCVKMIVEYSQLLSTAHRILDGEEYQDLTKAGRKIKRWRHPNAMHENMLYKASHINHPSAIWARASKQNYLWLFRLFTECLEEYTYRYGKHHSSGRLVPLLCNAPEKIVTGVDFAEPPLAMPDEYKTTDVVESYRNYYMGAKSGFASWKKRPVPYWYTGEHNQS